MPYNKKYDFHGDKQRGYRIYDIVSQDYVSNLIHDRQDALNYCDTLNNLYLLRKAVWDLDLTDEYVINNAKPRELIRMTRPVDIWKNLYDIMLDWSPNSPE